MARPAIYVLKLSQPRYVISALQTPVLYLSSSSDGFHLEEVKLKETDRDGLLVTFVGGLACK
jgi:hypothetical protein